MQRRMTRHTGLSSLTRGMAQLAEPTGAVVSTMAGSVGSRP
jgi:hypothetical protein